MRLLRLQRRLGRFLLDHDPASRHGNPYLFTGQRHDATVGLHHFFARTYDPRLGRWLQRDPLGYVDGASLYQYVQSNPTGAVDPTGRNLYFIRDPSQPLPPPPPPPPATGWAYSTIGPPHWMGPGPKPGSEQDVPVPAPSVGIDEDSEATAQQIAEQYAASRQMIGSAAAYGKAALGVVASFLPGMSAASAVAGQDVATGEDNSVSTYLGVAGDIIPLVGAVVRGIKVVARAMSKADDIADVVAGVGKAASKCKSAFASLKHAAKYGVRSYKELRDAKQGTDLVAHHLIEKRFSKVLGQKDNEMLSIVLTKEEHQAFTNAWRAEIAYGNGTDTATRESVESAARRIYAAYPEVLKALGLK